MPQAGMLLVYALPQAGFDWPSRTHITTRPIFDFWTQQAMRDIPNFRFRRQTVTPLLASAFDAATRELLAYDPADGVFGISLYEAIHRAQMNEVAWQRIPMPTSLPNFS